MERGEPRGLECHRQYVAFPRHRSRCGPTAAKLGKQIKYADKLGIPYVWFPNENPENDGGDEVKNIITGDQRPADAQSWQPDTVYAQQTVSINADNR